MIRNTFRKLATAFALVCFLPHPVNAASYPADPGLVDAINNCLLRAWPSITIDHITYDPPMASVYYVPGNADAYTQYFIEIGTTDDTWQCVHHVPSRFLSGPWATARALANAFTQNGRPLPSTLGRFVMETHGQIWHVHETFSIAQGHLLHAPPTHPKAP